MSSHARAEGIAWVRGDVEAAFALARAQHKPILLYWGAEWCVPCHDLKATVFTQRAFIEKTRRFVAVYLDGDDPGAQK
ncbi:MAG: thioredoxin family protein, partial [Steroidobacteraceae bacterium]